MGSLFGPKDNTVTQETNPFDGMPGWLKDAFKDKVDEGTALYDLAKEIGPSEIIGVSDEERAAMDEITGGYERSGELMDWAAGGLGMYDPGGGDYESEYTDSVVDTTLAGMQRQADRERLAREGRAAAVGGTSNTRASVAEAIAQQLTGMNMAEVEAKLRDDAFRFGTDASFREREGAMGEMQFADQLAGSELGRSASYGGALGSFGETLRGLEQARADGQKGHLQWLAEMYRGTDPTGGQPIGGTTTNTQPGPSTFSQILGAGASIIGGALASDENGKDFAESPGLMETPEGALEAVRELPDMERYSYKADSPEGFGHRSDEHAGLRAQDLEKINPDLVVAGTDGLKRVDSFLMLNMVAQAVKELDRKVEAR